MSTAPLRHCLTKICVLSIIIAISSIPFPLAAQIANTSSISHTDLFPAEEQLPTFDVRTLRQPKATKSSIEKKRRSLSIKTTTPDKVALRWDDQMDLPHHLHAYGTPLSLASNDDPAVIARRFALENSAVFEVSRSQLAAARVSALASDERAGITRLVLEQRVTGIRVFDSEMMFVLDRQGRVLNQSGSFIPEDSLQALTTTPALNSEQAFHRAAEYCEINLSSPIRTNVDKTAARERVLVSSDQLGSPTEVTLVYYPVTRDEVRLAYQVLLYSRVKITDSYLVVVDAQTGQLLRRDALTRSMQAAQGRVFTKESPLLGERELVTLSGDATASPDGWISENRTEGNNTRALFNPLIQGGKSTKANSSGAFDFPLNLDVSPLRSSKASTVNLFYWINECHDRFYSIGFTEEWRNFQNNNFDRGGLGNDRINAETLRGARLDPSSATGTVRNNAFFSPTLEGQSPLIAMLLWEFNRSGQQIRLDSSYDASVIIHEYTHGVSTRLTGTDNSIGLRNLQGAGMGEGWSDFFAASFLDSGERPLDANTVVGEYITASPSGVRSFPYTTRMDINPLTFINIAFSTAVHFQGTVWCSMLWELRQSLIARHGFDEGRRRAEQLVIDALKITPTAPLFTDARDALIIANQTVNGGADLDLIWRAFARRGLGLFASTSAVSPPTGFALTAVESYDLPSQFTAGSFFINEKASELTAIGESLPVVVIDRDLIGANEITIRARNLRTGNEVAVPLEMETDTGRFTGSINTAMPGQAGPQSLAVEPGDVVSLTYANERNEAGEAEVIEARTTAARRIVVYEDNFDQDVLNWIKATVFLNGVERPNLWHLTQHRAASPPNSLLFAKEKRGEVFAPQSSIGFINTPFINAPGLSEPQLEFDYLFNGFPGGVFELPDRLTAMVQGSSVSAQFNILPSDTTGFQSISIPIQLPGRSSGFLLAFFFFASSSSVNRKDFESIFIDNVRLTALSPQ